MTSDSPWEAERRVRFYAPKRTEGGKARQAGKTKAGRAARPQPAPTRVLQLRSRQDGAHLTAPASTCLPSPAPRGRPAACRLSPLPCPPYPVSGRRGLTCPPRITFAPALRNALAAAAGRGAPPPPTARPHGPRSPRTGRRPPVSPLPATTVPRQRGEEGGRRPGGAGRRPAA